MEPLKIIRNPDVKNKFTSYPDEVKRKLNDLRDLIFEVARAQEDIEWIEETLKWGEPSYLTKKGSTIRIDWKEKAPGQYAMYFKCTSKLVPTFKALFGNTFTYENNRAILFKMDDKVSKTDLKKCIELALRYHSIKMKPLLGVQ